jgi:tetratricopeptide (TPR) repeat protein
LKRLSRLQRFPVSPRLAAGGLLGIGVVLRAAEYLEGRSLWLDETFLSLNVLEKSWSGLLGPLDYQQGAPTGFLLLQKLAVLVAGPGEYGLRLVPFLAGIATLLFGWVLARRWLGSDGGLMALALLALCDPLVYFSAEAKQYGLDACVAVVLLWAGVRALQDGGRRDFALLACLGSILLWFSHPAVFVLAGVGAMLAVPAFRARDRGAILRLAAVAAAWSAGFVLCYAVSLRRLAANPFFLEFWAPSFVPPIEDLPGFARRVALQCAAFLDLSPSPLLLLAWLGLGAVACAALRPAFFVAVVVPLLAAAGASAASLYPLSERFLMFFVPMAILLLAEGLLFVTRGAERRLPWAGAIVLSAAFAFPAWRAVHELRAPRVVQEITPVLAFMKERVRPNDRIYVFHLASYPWRYYAARYGFNGDVEVPRDYADPHLASLETPRRRLFEVPGRNPVLLGSVSHFTSDRGRDVVRDLEPLLGTPRAWVLICHGAGGRNAGRSILASLDRVGRRLEEFRRPGAWGGCEAALYDLSGAAAAPAPDARPADPAGLYRAALDALRAGDSGRSLRLFERLEASGPLGADGLFAKGQAQQLDGDEAGAVETYRALLAVDPGHLRARFFLGEALAALDRCAEASVELRRVLAVRPDLDGARDSLARCRMRSRADRMRPLR